MNSTSMDRLVKEKRSNVMSRIRSKNTKPEKILRSELHKAGLRFRIHRNDLPGKPDIVFPSAKIAVFVHGCFWHCHENCINGRMPKSNIEYWQPKLARNVERDKMNIGDLKKLKWKVVVIWECDLTKKVEGIVLKIATHVNRVRRSGQQTSF